MHIGRVQSTSYITIPDPLIYTQFAPLQLGLLHTTRCPSEIPSFVAFWEHSYVNSGASVGATDYDVCTACKKAPSDHTAAARLYHGLLPHTRLWRWAVLTNAKVQGRRSPPQATPLRPRSPQVPPAPRPSQSASPVHAHCSRALCLPDLPASASPYDPPPIRPRSRGG